MQQEYPSPAFTEGIIKQELHFGFFCVDKSNRKNVSRKIYMNILCFALADTFAFTKWDPSDATPGFFCGFWMSHICWSAEERCKCLILIGTDETFWCFSFWLNLFFSDPVLPFCVVYVFLYRFNICLIHLETAQSMQYPCLSVIWRIQQIIWWKFVAAMMLTWSHFSRVKVFLF